MGKKNKIIKIYAFKIKYKEKTQAKYIYKNVAKKQFIR